MDEKRQREHLARANRHIAQLRNRISHQLQIVELLRRKGKPREEAAETLAILEDSLRILEHHRELILEGLQKAK